MGLTSSDILNAKELNIGSMLSILGDNATLKQGAGLNNFSKDILHNLPEDVSSIQVNALL
jgi:hypothetical protein